MRKPIARASLSMAIARLKKRDPSTLKDADCVRCRHVIAMMGFVCVLVLYTLKVNLAVAIVAMVKQPLKNTTGSAAPSACPSAYSEEEEFQVSDVELRDGEFEWDESTQGLVLSAFYYGYVSTQLLGGMAAIRWGGKMVVGPAVALAGVISAMGPVAARNGGAGPLIAVRVLQGAALGTGVDLWMAGDLGWGGVGGGLVDFTIHLGTVIGMTLSAWLVELGGWPQVFYFFGAVGVLFLVPWWLFVYDTPEEHPRISEAESEFLLRTLVNSKVDGECKSPPVPWAAILTCPSVWAIAVVHTGYAWVLFTFVNGLPTYMKNVLNYNIEKSAFLASLPYLLQWFTSSASGILSQWLREKGIVSHLTAYRLMNGIFLLGSAASLLAITFLGCSYVPIIAMLCLYGVLGGMFYGGSYLNHMDIAVNYSGILSGINQTLSSLAGVVAPIVRGQLTQGKETLTQWNVVFYIAVGISVGSYLIFHFFGSVEEQPWNKPKMADPEKPAEQTETTRF
ncbi:sialin-like [Hetaerina americana]|uniref:sialin-like n=1 Tax=Hetaerina americana TaxID=62018 RepID=UPI003A7F2C42